MDDPLAGVLVEDVVLNWLKVGVTQRVSAEFADTLRVQQHVDHLLGQWVYSIAGYVLAEHLPPETVTERKPFAFDVPASPWQQFKAVNGHRWWVRWLVKRRPVRLVTHRFTGELSVRLDRYWTYPQARVPYDHGRPYRVAVLNREIDWAAIDDEGTQP